MFEPNSLTVSTDDLASINCFIISSALVLHVININIFSSVESIRMCYNECFMLSLEDHRKTDRLKPDWSFLLL